MRWITSTPLGLAPVLGVVLLVLGIGVDLGFTQQHLHNVRRLVSERSQLRDRLRTQESRELDSRRLASYFEVESLTALLDPSQQTEPVTFIGNAVTDAGLTRLELGTVKNSEIDGIQRTQFFLRVNGRYKQVWGFVNQLESGSRVVTIDALKIENLVESTRVEARFNLSVYDPVEGT